MPPKKIKDTTGKGARAVKKSAERPAKKISINNSAVEVYRFAHPFYTSTPINERKQIRGIGICMTDYIANKLEPIPAPLRDPTMTLEEIIGKKGVSEVSKYGFMSFHATGDTGAPKSDAQQLVADAMSGDYDASFPEKSPAFFLHLGDVDYYDNTDKGYHAQFYEPYKKYPGKIIAIPGNHDGELFKYDGTSVGQKKTLEAFMKNFCQPKPGVPPAAGSIYRQMVSQPGVYWLLDTPFVQIIGLYSNVAEGPGYISGKQPGNKQKEWFTKTLVAIKKERDKGDRKGLIIAVHHPPFSNGGHSSSTDMLADIDDSCQKAGIMPDVVLAAHAHCYQRFTRKIIFENKKLEIPFIVCGCGGHGSQPIQPANGEIIGDHVFEKSLNGFGYLKIIISQHQITIDFINVDQYQKKLCDSVKVNY